MTPTAVADQSEADDADNESLHPLSVAKRPSMESLSTSIKRGRRISASGTSSLSLSASSEHDLALYSQSSNPQLRSRSASPDRNRPPKPSHFGKGKFQGLEADVEEMRQRSAANRTFINAKLTPTTIVLSYKAEKKKAVTDLFDFTINTPLFEYVDQTWSFADLALAMKTGV